jgi:hypothetical protein
MQLYILYEVTSNGFLSTDTISENKKDHEIMDGTMVSRVQIF